MAPTSSLLTHITLTPQNSPSPASAQLALYSDSYSFVLSGGSSGAPRRAQMFLARVAAGRAQDVAAQMNCARRNPAAGFHSVRGCVRQGGFGLAYATFRPSQSFPHYLATYEEGGGEPPLPPMSTAPVLAPAAATAAAAAPAAPAAPATPAPPAPATVPSGGVDVLAAIAAVAARNVDSGKQLQRIAANEDLEWADFNGKKLGEGLVIALVAALKGNTHVTDINVDGERALTQPPSLPS